MCIRQRENPLTCSVRVEWQKLENTEQKIGLIRGNISSNFKTSDGLDMNKGLENKSTISQ